MICYTDGTEVRYGDKVRVIKGPIDNIRIETGMEGYIIGMDGEEPELLILFDKNELVIIINTMVKEV
jgi:hypothetical protein